jgi:hypothetical protein
MTTLPRFFQLIGSDRHLTQAEVEHAVGPHPLMPAAWALYQQQFGMFTGSTIDPLFHRLPHPSRRAGSVQLDSGTTVMIVGTGPSLRPNLESLQRLRSHLRIFTSPRGAEVLLNHGVVPDLVLVEHQTAVDAHHSARHFNDCTNEVLGACPLVAADWRTPATLLRGVASDALFVPAPLPTWGLWPATAAAMAVAGGATRVALLGVDLGTAAAPDPTHLPLGTLLALIARLAPIVALDCGAGGAVKRGWLRATLQDAASTMASPVQLSVYPASSIQERFEEARATLDAHRDVIERARGLLALALDARAGNVARAAHLRAGTVEIMTWRDDLRTRLFAQECLGVSFLPRLWRSGIDVSLGQALWRPLMLATHEFVRQADALRTATRVARAA